MERKKLKVINIICLVIYSVMVFSIFIEPFFSIVHLSSNSNSQSDVGGFMFIVSLIFAPILAFIILNLIILSVVNLIYDNKNDKIGLATTIISIILQISFYLLLVSGSFITFTLGITCFILQIIRVILIERNNKAVKLKKQENM